VKITAQILSPLVRSVGGLKPTDRALSLWIGHARRQKRAIVPYLESIGVRFKKLGRKKPGAIGAKDAAGKFISQKVSRRSLAQWYAAKKIAAHRAIEKAKKLAILPKYQDSGRITHEVGPKNGRIVYDYREFTFPVKGRAKEERYSTLARLALAEVKPLLLDNVAVVLVAIVFLSEENAEDYRRAWTRYHRTDDEQLEKLAQATDPLLDDFRHYQEIIMLTDIVINTTSIQHKKKKGTTKNGAQKQIKPSR